MKLSEAIKILENGGKIRQKSWVDGNTYLYLKANVVHHSILANEWVLFCADNWEEYIQEVKLSTLKVGDKWKYKNGSIKFLILPKEMIVYLGPEYNSKKYIVCQDLSSSFVDLCAANVDELVVQIKE